MSGRNGLSVISSLQDKYRYVLSRERNLNNVDKDGEILSHKFL